jgi:integrase
VLRSGADADAVAHRFSALTGHADVSALHWRQIDLAAGTLIHRTKAAGKITVHSLALPGAAIEILRGSPSRRPGDAVFPHATPYPAALLLMLLTMTRRQEAALTRWRDIDFESKTWTIPRDEER